MKKTCHTEGKTMARAPNRRRILVVDPRLQFRYLILPIVVTATTAVCLLALFLLQFSMLKELPGASQDFQDDIGRTQIQAGFAVGAVLLGHVALVVWLGLTISHKFAGPLYRFKQAMKQVTTGAVNVQITLRRGDELTDMAELFNKMTVALVSEQGKTGDREAEGPPESEG